MASTSTATRGASGSPTDCGKPAGAGPSADPPHAVARNVRPRIQNKISTRDKYRDRAINAREIEKPIIHKVAVANNRGRASNGQGRARLDRHPAISVGARIETKTTGHI